MAAFIGNFSCLFVILLVLRTRNVVLQTPKRFRQRLHGSPRPGGLEPDDRARTQALHLAPGRGAQEQPGA